MYSLTFTVVLYPRTLLFMLIYVSCANANRFCSGAAYLSCNHAPTVIPTHCHCCSLCPQDKNYITSSTMLPLIEEKRRTINLLYTQHRESVYALQTFLSDDVLPRVADELHLTDEEVDIAREWINDCGEFPHSKFRMNSYVE